MRGLHAAVIILFVVTAGLLAAPFRISAVKALAPATFTGTYLSEVEDNLSWIVIRQRSGKDLTCEWHRIRNVMNDKMEHRTYVFRGKAIADRLQLSAVISTPRRVIVEANGIREGETIRMSLSIEGMVIHTAIYKPSGVLAVMSAQSRFSKAIEAIAQETEDKRKQSISQSKAAEDASVIEARKEHKAIITEGNSYVRGILELKRDYTKTIRQFESNTSSTERSFEQLRGSQELKQTAYRNQHFSQMREQLDKTYVLQNEQDDIQRALLRNLKPFLLKLAEKGHACDGKQVELEQKNMCTASMSLHATISREMKALAEIFSTIRESYVINIRKQKKLLGEAETFMNEHAMER